MGLAVMAGSARAEIISDNLSKTPHYHSNATESKSWGQKFSTGSSGTAYKLQSVVLKAQRIGTDLPLLTLYSDNGNLPGTPLSNLTFTTPILDLPASSSYGDATFTSPEYLLSPNTSYWMLLSVADPTKSSEFGWAYTASSEGAGAGFNVANAKYDGTWKTYSNYPFLMQVNAAAVPEPTSLLLLSLGGAFALWMKRRHSK
jgi:hypothetical protein